MPRSVLRSLLIAAMLLSLVLSAAPRTAAADGVTFTLSVPSAFVRAGPSLGALRVASIFKDQAYLVTGRTADNSWLRLDLPGAGAWILASLGRVDGDLSIVPVSADAAPVPTAAPAVRPASAASDVTFTVAVKSFYARSTPSYAGLRVKSLFKGEAYPVIAQYANGTWLRLDYPVARTDVWVPKEYGLVYGNLDGAPVVSAVANPAGALASGSAGAVLPTVSARARQIYRSGLALGNNPRVFSKVGDCQGIPPDFLAPFDDGDYRLGSEYAYLRDAIRNFAGSFARDSEAALYGLTAVNVLDPLWADPGACGAAESPLACEIRLHRPSLIIVGLGTEGRWDPTEKYEAAMRQIIETSIASGALPLLSTKADDVEGGNRFNLIVERLAAEYDLPLWNFWQATRSLPNYGLVDGYHLSPAPAHFDNPANLQYGWPLRNLTALQALDAVWKGVR